MEKLLYIFPNAISKLGDTATLPVLWGAHFQVLETGDNALYEMTEVRNGQAPGEHYASVIDFGEGKYKRHSTSRMFKEPEQPRSFLDTLHSFSNQKMWAGMSVDEDEEWILDALMEGTLDIAHDGSYQLEVTKDVLLHCNPF